jgi:hypothetical protein
VLDNIVAVAVRLKIRAPFNLVHCVQSNSLPKESFLRK